MKFKELLEVGKFEEYHLGVKSFTKEEIEKDYRYFLEQNVTSIVPRAYTVRKFIDKKLYSIVLVDAFVYLDTLNSGENQRNDALSAIRYSTDVEVNRSNEININKLNESEKSYTRSLYGKHEGYYKWDLAIDWFQMSNDDFYNKYKFSWTPHECNGLFDMCKKYLFEESMADIRVKATRPHIDNISKNAMEYITKEMELRSRRISNKHLGE